MGDAQRRIRAGRARTLVCAALIVAGAGSWSCGSARPLSSVRASGNEYFYAQRYEAAEAEYREFVERKPSDARAHYDLARTLLALGRPAEAREKMVTAVHLEPRNGEYLDLLAEAMLRSNAEEDLRVFLDRQVADSETWQSVMRRGRYLGRLGDADEGERSLKRAARMNRGVDAAPQLALAEFYGSIGDEREQIRRLRMALGAEPRNQDVRARLRALGIVPGPTIELTPEERATPAPPA